MRKLSKVVTEEPSYDLSRQWRTNLPCAIQARQSTTKQTIENKESAEAQTKDQLQKVITLGWKDDLITVFIEGEGKRGVSGRLRIDERPGLSALMEGIYNDSFKTIFTWNESRLFRDEFMIGPDTFIKACYDHDVVVVTWMYRYDFRRNPYDMDQFREQCKIAARFIKDHVKYMNLMRDRVAQRGQYFGGRVPIGYILDENDRFIPYEPHAKIVRWIFRRYKQVGSASQVARELNERQSYVFPPYEAGVKAPYTNLTVRYGGYGITTNGVLSVLSNVQYLGYFVFKQQVMREDGKPVVNHPPILKKIIEDDGEEVDYEELFWYAFNRLSPTTIDGEVNELREKQVARYDQRGTVPAKALLKPVIKTFNGAVYVTKELEGNNPEQYTIDPNVPDYNTIQHSARVDISLVDAAFLERMFSHLRIWKEAQEAQKELEIAEPTNVGEVINEQLIREKSESKKGSTEIIDGQLEQLKPKLAHFSRLVKNGYDLDEKDLKEYTKELASLRKVENALVAAREAIEKQEKEREEGQDLLDRTLEEWNTFDLEQKRRVIKLVAESVFISKVAPTWLKIEIIWKGIGIPTADIGYLMLNSAANKEWNDEEIALLRELYPDSKADEILEKLPDRAWEAIKQFSYRKNLRRNIRNTPKDKKLMRVSLRDLEFMEKHSIDAENISKGVVCWSDSETLLPMLEEDIIDVDDLTTSENEERMSSSSRNQR